MEPLRLEFSVACTAEHAFDVWANRIAAWWPRDHTKSGDPNTTVVLEPRPGGRLYERTPAGVEHEWGEVLAWEPPLRLAYLWHIYGERGDATEVEISFAEQSETTTVTIVHRGWDGLGARGAGLRARNHQAWAGLRAAYERWLLNTDGTPQGRPDG